MTPNQKTDDDFSPAASNNQPQNSTRTPSISGKPDSNDTPDRPNSNKNEFDLTKRISHILINNHSDSGGDGTPDSTPRATPVNLVESVDSIFEHDLDEAGASSKNTAPSSPSQKPQDKDKELPDIDFFNLESYVEGLASGMKLKDIKFDLQHHLTNIEYKFDTVNQSQMQMNIKENDSDKLHIALVHLINTQEGLQEAIGSFCENMPENEHKCVFGDMFEMLEIVLGKLKRKQIIIDMRERSIEIDGIEVWSTVQRFVKNCARKQWYVNGKALGQFVNKLSKNDIRKKESDEENKGCEGLSVHSTSPAQDCATQYDNSENENFDKGCTPQ